MILLIFLVGTSSASWQEAPCASGTFAARSQPTSGHDCAACNCSWTALEAAINLALMTRYADISTSAPHAPLLPVPPTDTR